MPKIIRTAKLTLPEEIDYATGAVYVDAMAVSSWSQGKKMRAMGYMDMLYSFDGMEIEHMPIGSRNWPEKLRAKHVEIRKLEGQEKKPLKSWSSSAGRRKGSRTRKSLTPMGMPAGLPPGMEQLYQ